MTLVFAIDFDSGAALHAVCRLLECCEQDFGQLLPGLKFHGASISFFFFVVKILNSCRCLFVQ